MLARSRVARRLFLLALAAALIPLAAAAELVISFLHTTPTSAPEHAELAIAGEMFGGSELESAQVSFRTAGTQSWSAVPLVPASGFSWRALIPAARIEKPALEYFAVGIDGLGERHAIFASESEPARIPVVGELDDLLVEQRPRAPTASELALPSPDSKNESQFQKMNPDSNPPPAALENREPAASAKALVIPRARTEPEDDADSRTLQARAVIAGEGNAAPPESLPSAPGAVKIVTAPGPSGAAVPPPKKSKRARPSDLSLFAPDDSASLADGIERPPAESPGLSSVLGEDLLKSLGVRTVADALAFVPGLFITTDALRYSEASVRGLRDDPGVLVLYDGQVLNGALDGRAFLELPAENLERIEVLRGPEAARYGGGALLAVINLVPRRKDGIAGALTGDSSRAGQLDFHGGGQLTGVQIDGDVDLRGADSNGAVIGQDALTSTLRAEGLLGANQPAGNLDDSGLLLNAGGRIHAATAFGGELEMKLRVIHEKRGVYLGEGGVVGGDPTLGGASGSEVERDLLAADLAWLKSYGAVQIALRAFGRERDEVVATELAPPGISLGGQSYPQGVHVETQSAMHSLGGEAGVRFQAAALGLRGEARMGLQRDWLGVYQPTSDVSTTGQPQGALLPSPLPLAENQPDLSGRTDLFAQGQLESQTKLPVSVLLGLRADALIGADAAECGGSPCLEPTLAARPTLTLLSPNAAIIFNPGAGAILKLLGGRSFRAPDFDELSSRPLVPANLLPDQLHGAQALAPELSESAALSAEWSGPLADGRGHLRAAGSITDLSRAIVALPDGDHLDLANADQPVRSFSLEIEGRLEASRRNWQMAQLTWTRARDLNAPESVWLLRDLPQVRAVLAAAAPIGAWLNAILSIEGDGARQNNQRTPLEASRPYQIGASALVCATLRTEPLFGRLELALSLRDLLGAATPDDLPRPDLVPGLLPGPGFSAALTARAKF